MSPQQTADQALAIYQANRLEPRDRVAALLDQFFNFKSKLDYEEILSRVSVAVTSEDASCVTIGSPCSSQFSDHF